MSLHRSWRPSLTSALRMELHISRPDSTGPDTGIHSSHHKAAYSDSTDEGPAAKALSEGKAIHHSQFDEQPRRPEYGG